MPFTLHVLTHRQYFDATLLPYPTVVLRTFESIGTETVVVTHEKGCDVILVPQIGHELSGREGVDVGKREHDDLTVLTQFFLTFLEGAQQIRLVIGVQHRTRVLGKSDDEGLQASLGRQALQVLKEKLMAFVYPIEESYGRYTVRHRYVSI